MSNVKKFCDYVVTAPIFSNEHLNVSIGYKGENKVENFYIINEFPYQSEDTSKFEMLFSIFSSPEKPKEFEDFFAEDDKFYAIFKYVKSEDISRRFRKGFNNMSFDERCAILESILVLIDKHYNLCDEFLGCITEPKNIHIDEQKSIHLIYDLQYIEKYKNNEYARDMIFKNISDIIYILLEPEANRGFNKSLHIVLDKCKRGVYSSIPQLIIELQKAQKVSKASSWKSYIMYQISLRKHIISKISKFSMVALLVFGVMYLAYEKLTKGQESGSSTAPVSIGNINYNANTNDATDKSVSVENIDNQTGAINEADIILTKGLDIEYEDYIVQYGDTISSICSQYYKEDKYITAISTFNGIDVNEQLTAGTILKLPNRTAIALYLSN